MYSGVNEDRTLLLTMLLWLVGHGSGKKLCRIYQDYEKKFTANIRPTNI